MYYHVVVKYNVFINTKMEKKHKKKTTNINYWNFFFYSEIIE